MNREIGKDLSRKLQHDLSDVLERNLNVAQAVLTMPEVALLLIEAAVMMTRTAGATMANTVGDHATREDIIYAHDLVINLIMENIQASRADSLERAFAEIARRKAAA